MECNQSFIEVLMSRKSAALIRRCAWTLFFMGVTLSAPVCFGQRFVQPSYTPSSADAYFSGDSNRVFPNPFQREFTPFKAEPGESRPVPDREVRQKTRAERRERFLKRFSGSQNEEKDTKERLTSTSTVTYPNSAPAGSNVSPRGNSGVSPAPFLWDMEERSTSGEITKALPFNDPEDVEEEESDLLLEDVAVPAPQKLPTKDSTQTLPRSILEDTPSASQKAPAKPRKIQPKPAVETEEPALLDLDSDEFTEEDAQPQTRRKSPRALRRLGTKQNTKPEIIEAPESDEDSDEEIDLILEPIPQTSHFRRERSGLKTAGIHQDFSVQTVAFFPTENGSQNTVQYPVSKKPNHQGTFSGWPGFSRSEKQKKAASETKHSDRTEPAVYHEPIAPAAPAVYPESMVPSNPPKAVPSRSADTREEAIILPEHIEQVPEETLLIPNDSVATRGRRRQNTTSWNSSPSVPIAETREQLPEQTQWNPVSTANPPATEPSSVPTYDPQFPERGVPTTRLEMSLPIRQVFKDFGIRKPLEKSALPWYAEYIRDLDVNEEHLFNSLRVLGNSKLSQSQCQFTLMEASIIASQPKTAEEANRLLNIYDNIEYGILQKTRKVDARTDLNNKQKEELKAEIILDFMHQKVFVKYVLEGTTINNLLEHGYYNCVTASLLFCSLAEKAGLNVTAVELPGHAMCWVYLSDGERLQVETTCGNWFKYRNDPETQQKVICKLIRDASPQLKDQSDKMLLLQVPQPISDKRLIAKIYYNRGVDLLSSADYAGALEANAIAYCLDLQSETTFGNLLATMNNWAIALCREGKYEEATALLREGLRHQPNYPPFKNNHTHVYHHWVDSLYRNGQMNEALHVAAIAAAEQPDVDHFKRLQEQIQQNIAIANQQQTTTR